MTEIKGSKAVVRGDELDEFSHWRLPDMSASAPTPGANLLGLKNAHIEPVVEEEIIRPPTLAEIEAMRDEAEQEGFSAGKSEGHAQGLAEGKLEGLELGHAEGFAQGQEQGLAQGLSEAGALLGRFEALLGQFALPLALLDNEIEQELLKLSMTLCRQILRHELKTHPEHLLAALQEGVACLPLQEQEIRLRLNPEDVALVQSLYDEQALKEQRWRLLSDPLLARGDCLIESQRSRVSLRLEERIASVLAAPEQRLETLKREARVGASQLEEKFGQLNLASATGCEPEAVDDKTSAPSAE